MRRGITEIFMGVLTMQSQPFYSAANRAMALDIAARHADVFASLLAPGDRKAVIGIVNRSLPSATPEDHAKLLIIRAAMSATGCTGLCAVD